MATSIFLVGFMGSGKTYWGKRLSASVELPFIDLDGLIVSRMGQSIPELFAIHGEAGFRRIEQFLLHELLAGDAAVVATGGGAPCFFDNMDRMNRDGRTIYLQVPVDVLAERLGRDMQKRPLLSGLTPADLPAFIEQLLQKRAPFYEMAGQIPEWSGVEEEYSNNILQAATRNSG